MTKKISPSLVIAMFLSTIVFLGGCRSVTTKNTDFNTFSDLLVDANDGDWEIIEDIKIENGIFTSEIVSLSEEYENGISGQDIQFLAEKNNALLGQNHAKILFEHQDLIPDKWRKRHYLVFPGTIWQNSNGKQAMLYLIWHFDQWCPHFNYVNDYWPVGASLVRIRG